MAEGFITRRGGVSSEQALAPTITFVSKTDSQIVFTIKNNDDATAVILWELDDATPDANSFELAADTTSSNITVTGLDDDTEFIVYATANVTGKVKSNVSQLSITTDQLPTFISATGGTTLEYNQSGKRYKSHTFTSSENFVVNSLSNQGASFNQVDYLIIAGGAGGGGSRSGGGGAGGYRTTNGTSGANTSALNKVTVTATSYGINVGAGGAGGASAVNGTNGSNSSAFSITSTGGGGGGGNPQNGVSGGSGGGGGGATNDGGTPGSSGAGTSAQGRNGGNGSAHIVGFGGAGGGGGGASAVGSNGTGANLNVGGAGGNGLANLLRTGSNETRAGGGGGGGQGGAGAGGSGGGATGNGGAGTANTGGGGGGNSFGAAGGSGGSGIVIIRYEIAPSA